jgi:hypothetical protein
MEEPPGKTGTELSEELEKYKTAECLSVSILGEYIEHTLPSEDRDQVEQHLRSCAYCLNQLVELRELLFLEKRADPLPRDLEESLQRLATKQDASDWINTWSIKDKFLAFWNSLFAWQGASALAITAILAIYIGIFPRGPNESPVKAPIPPTVPSIAVEPPISPSQPLEVKGPLLPKGLQVALSGFRVVADVPRIASTLQKLGKNLILESTRGERDIAVFQKAGSSVVIVLAGKDSLGSGVLISGDGRVLTNWHVIGGETKATVVLKPKDSAELKKELAFSAVVEKIDQVADLALLRITNPPQ